MGLSASKEAEGQFHLASTYVESYSNYLDIVTQNRGLLARGEFINVL